MRVPFVSTVDNLADFFTKSQPPDLFFKMRDTIMNVPACDRASSTGGGVERTYEFTRTYLSVVSTPCVAKVAVRRKFLLFILLFITAHRAKLT